MASAIQEQVKLPISIACEVVLQGIRIRLGRSVVTMMGVVLGIAFLMSILAGQSIQQGVAAEESIRQAQRRMANLLAAEVGPPRERIYAVWLLGEPDAAERRLLPMLHEEGAAAVRLVRGTVPVPAEWSHLGEPMTPEAAATDAHALLLLGQGPLPAADWPALLALGKHPIMAIGATGGVSALSGVTVMRLQRELREDELERQHLLARQTAFRRGWIIVISLMVTVICISNSMLMSVTERFKEIGTMKCLGALSGFIRRMFLIESSLLGLLGSLLGCLVGLGFSVLAYSFSYGFGLTLGAIPISRLLLYAGACLLAGVILSIVAALYPARIAARMTPAHALRTNV